MKYSFEKINTVPACNALLAGAQRKKQTLERKRRNLGEAIDTHHVRMDQINRESAEVQASLEVFTTAYAALPEGKDKTDLKIKRLRLELCQAVLEKKAYIYNVSSLLAKEVKYNSLDAQLSALQAYIAAVEAHRSMLDRASVRVTHGVTPGLQVVSASVAPEPAHDQAENPVLRLVPRVQEPPALAVAWRAVG